MIKIALAGAFGRVGKLITSLVEGDPDFEIVSQLTRNENKKSQSTKLKNVDVFIDFSVPSAVMEHLKLCSSSKTPIVIGVTGLTKSEKDKILEATRDIPILFSPNMSVGVNVAYKAIECVAAALKGTAEVALQESHHQGKKDAPSGTALKMQEIIALTGFKEGEKPAISSLRLGDLMGEHKVLFSLAGEQLEIRHQTTNRDIFARGALLAAKWIRGKDPGLYDMQDVLGLRG